jgi:hypothetical protein
MRCTLLAAALAVAMIPLTAGAAEAQMSARASRATSVALGQATKDFTQKQVAVLQLTAHAAATAQLCDGISLDDVAVQKAVGEMMNQAAGGMSQAEQIRLHDLALITFGTLSGLALAEESRRGPAFCKAAMADAKDPEKFVFLRLDAPAAR